jgi:dTMP kinase
LAAKGYELPMKTPRFIVLDGMDGAGKSSQLTMLADWLRETGREVVTCRDPGSTPVGDAIRAIVLDRHDLHLDSTSEMFLYMAARAQLVAEVVRPSLGRGAWVVSDRFLLSNVVYQGHAGGLDPATLWRVGEVATGGLVPDLVVVLDVDLATAASRMNRPLDKLESRGDAYRERLRAGYLHEAAAAPDRIRVIDARGTPHEVWQRVRSALVDHFPELG